MLITMTKKNVSKQFDYELLMQNSNKLFLNSKFDDINLQQCLIKRSLKGERGDTQISPICFRSMSKVRDYFKKLNVTALIQFVVRWLLAPSVAVGGYVAVENSDTILNLFKQMAFQDIRQKLRIPRVIPCVERVSRHMEDEFGRPYEVKVKDIPHDTFIDFETMSLASMIERGEQLRQIPTALFDGPPLESTRWDNVEVPRETNPIVESNKE